MSYFPESQSSAPVTLVERFKSISPALPVVSYAKLLAGDESQISKMIIASTLGRLFYLDLRSNEPKEAKILSQFRVLLSLATEGMKRGTFMIKNSPAVQAGSFSAAGRLITISKDWALPHSPLPSVAVDPEPDVPLQPSLPVTLLVSWAHNVPTETELFVKIATTNLFHLALRIIKTLNPSFPQPEINTAGCLTLSEYPPLDSAARTVLEFDTCRLVRDRLGIMTMLFAPPVGLMVRRDHPDEDGHIQTTLINVPEDHVLVSLGDPCVGVQHVLDQSFIKQASEYEVCYRLSACRPLETKTDSDYVGSSTGSSDEEVAFEAASVG